MANKQTPQASTWEITFRFTLLDESPKYRNEVELAAMALEASQKCGLDPVDSISGGPREFGADSWRGRVGQARLASLVRADLPNHFLAVEGGDF